MDDLLQGRYEVTFGERTPATPLLQNLHKTMKGIFYMSFRGLLIILSNGSPYLRRILNTCRRQSFVVYQPPQLLFWSFNFLFLTIMFQSQAKSNNKIVKKKAKGAQT